ncbi:cytochrome c nitrite reductase small subunit [Candidatus Sumerlaeota bacterium]|nr:cytochrome c nitrite reductase small subunit [Candidatus Sumerlaeota bacterium]
MPKGRIYIIGLLLTGVLLGSALGVGGFTFFYAKGASYMTDDPTACANCHVMQNHLDGWAKSSHHAVATCNDCHTPHAFIPKYMTKASNGWHHSWAFTTGDFPERIQITEGNRKVAEDSCRKCHQDITLEIDPGHSGSQPLECLHCHWSVGHLE